MKVESYTVWGNKHPSYRVESYDDYQEICKWMHSNSVEHFLLSAGLRGYIFQVRNNVEWFILKWS